ncbi:hypothetical protein A9Q84_10425 [Halobacteriovorax marinus]|uniref:SH3b domain-containing protein n=1 Tax=Halobacteriovorax marinus TaxID=97084 RepID=A0A1Y5F781_9BACT|nr:hypothetical protein A9Q84_10425 [Halobacteriovorax marinus]
MKRIMTLILLFLITLAPNVTAAPDDTPDWWNCNNRTSGEWKFGRAPDVCDMDSFIDLNYVNNEFSDFVFYDSEDRDSERERYMTEVHALINEVANYYYKKRRSEVSEAELQVFLRSALSIGHQESFWSHYRTPTHGKVQFMRSGGDYGHGHGMFQVDDRWHFPAIKDGTAANIVMNMIYSLEEYFDAWERAPAAGCAAEDDYEARGRSAYSAFNGGPSRICRWTNPNDRWARNDKGWWSKYQNRGWENYIQDFDKVSSVDVDCIVQGNEGCLRDSDDDDEPQVGRIYKSEAGKFCSFTNGEFECVSLLQDASCLALKGGDDFANYRGRFRRMPKDFEDEYNFSEIDRHEVCHNFSNDLTRVSKSIKVLKNINLRKSPAGAWLVTIPANRVVQVLDFNLKSSFKEERYYKVKYKNHIGFIYAGNKEDSKSWSLEVSEKAEDRTIAANSDKVRVVEESGVSVYSADGTLLRELVLDEVIEVMDSSVLGSLNEIRYAIGNDEFVKAGFSGDLYNLEEVFSVIKKTRTPVYRVASLRKKTWWKKLRLCPSKKCKKSGSLKGPRLSKKTFHVTSHQGDWLLIEQGSKKGWLRSKYVVYQ